MRKKIFALFTDFKAYGKLTIQQNWCKKSKILNFFVLCRIVTGQNFESSTALERTERPVGRGGWYKCGQNYGKSSKFSALKGREWQK